MYHNHIKTATSHRNLSQQAILSENSLGITKVDFTWDQEGQQLNLMVETSKMVDGDINATIKGNRLLLEAPLISIYNKPFKTHLLDQEFEEEFEEGFMLIGFSELKLKSGFHYKLISCKAVDPNMIKLVLEYSSKHKIWIN